MKIIYFTDTHLNDSGGPLYGLDARARLMAVIERINEYHADATLCVVGGDLTQDGGAAAFKAFRDGISRLVIPYRLLIGNHDDRNVFQRVFPEQLRDEHGFVQSFMDTAEGRLVFLDTNLEGESAGYLCNARLNWLKAVLESNQKTPLFIFMHHPPFDIGSAWLDAIKLNEADAFRSLIGAHRRRIRHLFFGHVHRLMGGSWMGIPFSSVRGTNHQRARQRDSIIEGKKINHGPVFYAVVQINSEVVTVEFRDLLTGEPSTLARPAGIAVLRGTIEDLFLAKGIQSAP